MAVHPCSSTSDRRARWPRQLPDERPPPTGQPDVAARAAGQVRSALPRRRPAHQTPSRVGGQESHGAPWIRFRVIGSAPVADRYARPIDRFARTVLWNRPASWNPGGMSGVQSVERAFAILRCLAGGPAGVSEIAERVGLPKSTVSRLLVDAAGDSAPSSSRGSGNEYRVGGGLVDIAAGALPGRNLVTVARPHLVELVDDPGRGGRAVGPRRRRRRLRRPGLGRPPGAGA